MEHLFLMFLDHTQRSWVRIPPGSWIFVCCECRVSSGRGLCDELITRPEESYRLCCVVVCDLEISRIGAPYIYIYIYIYIYDINSLRVNDLTLILLTWRKWWANNASKQQMGFNSAFKGLMWRTLYSYPILMKFEFLDRFKKVLKYQISWKPV